MLELRHHDALIARQSLERIGHHIKAHIPDE